MSPKCQVFSIYWLYFLLLITSFNSNMIYLSKRGGEKYTPLRSPEGVVLVANQHER